VPFNSLVIIVIIRMWNSSRGFR